MSLRMNSATFRRDSSYRQIQKRVPADIVAAASGRPYPITLPACDERPEETLEVRIRAVIKLSLRVREPAAARLRSSAFNAQFLQICERLRSKPRDLSHKDTVALSGEIYRLVVSRFEQNPGDEERWAVWKAFTWAAVQGRIPDPPAVSWREIMDERRVALDRFDTSTGPVLLDVIEQLPQGSSEKSLEVRFGLLATWVLTRHGLEVSAESRLALLRQVAEAAFDAGWRLKRAAVGDYSPDPREARFPPVDVQRNVCPLTLEALFDRWRRETKPGGSTVTTWKSSLKKFMAHGNYESLDSITRKNIIKWKDHLVAEGLAVGTINGTYLACLNALFSFGIRNELITKNPVEGVRVVQKDRAGARQLPYEDIEVARLLALCAKETNVARHWIPLLAACTGARAGELAQLWAERVREVDGVFVMELRPAEDGGSLKNEGSERLVPLHPELINAGFLAFVAQKRNGPLFYGRASGKGLRHPSKGVVNRLGDWIREQPGFDNPRKAPSHAFRHWWKSAASRIGIPDSRADAIQGHRTQGEAARYRHFDLNGLAADIAKIPIPGRL